MGYRLLPLPESRFARIAEALAYAAVPVALIAILATRSGRVEPLHGIAVLTGSVVLAAASGATAFVAALEIWRRGATGLGRLFKAVLVAALLLAYPVWLAGKAIRLPVMNDISTDLDDPPAFSGSRRALAARGGYRPPDIDRRRRAPQLIAYPAIRTITLDSEPEEAFQAVARAVKALKWRVIEEIRPDDRRGIGRIDAIDESLLMRFPDDITIRLRWTGSESRIDIRSVSRVGRHDLGTNAARIERLAQEIANPPE